MLYTVQRYLKGIGLLVVVMLFSACTQQEQQQQKKETKKGTKVTEAIATINPAEGEKVNGTVTFTRTTDGVQISGELSNLSQGKHGFHIHEYGDCSDQKGFSSAGGHYNPTNEPHGPPTADQRHVGDMGNIPAGSEGNGELTYTDNVITLNGKNNVIGRAVIIHAGEDDLESQPSGAAGGRIGCGVIGIVKTQTDTAAASGGNM